MDTLALILAIVGAVNWGLVGFARLDRECQPHRLRGGRSGRALVHHASVPQKQKNRGLNKNSRSQENACVREFVCYLRLQRMMHSKLLPP